MRRRPSQNDGPECLPAGRVPDREGASRMIPSVRDAILAIMTLLASATVAGAAQYPGWGDTGWGYASKRECCNAAIEIAAANSAQACIDIGGGPRPFAGASQRGAG